MSMDEKQLANIQHELFKHATESVVVTDSKGFILLINPATEKLFGYTSEELKGKRVEFLMSGDIRQTHERHRDNYNQNPHSRKMGIGLDLKAQRKDKTEFPVEVSLSPFEVDGERLVIAFIVDITTRKHAEQQLLLHKQMLEDLTKELKAHNEKLEAKVIDRTKILQEALIEIEKSRKEMSEALAKEKELNELKSRFLSMASHEFRTPLTTILSSASLITAYPEKEQQEKRIKHVERIQSAVNNLNDILSDFLSLSRIEEGKINTDKKVFNVKTLISELISDVIPIKKQGQTIHYAHKGQEEIYTDQKLLRNIIINLLSNAIKFSDEDKLISIVADVDTKQMILKIKDEGIGISKEDQQHLFERFFRGHNATNIQGTGLGLNIVARYLDLLDGHIEPKSELNKGTEFIITLPIAKNAN